MGQSLYVVSASNFANVNNNGNANNNNASNSNGVRPDFTTIQIFIWTKIPLVIVWERERKGCPFN